MNIDKRYSIQIKNAQEYGQKVRKNTDKRCRSIGKENLPLYNTKMKYKDILKVSFKKTNITVDN